MAIMEKNFKLAESIFLEQVCHQHFVIMPISIISVSDNHLLLAIGLTGMVCVKKLSEDLRTCMAVR